MATKTAEGVMLFTAPGCGGCEELKEAHSKHGYELEGVPEGTTLEFMDVTSDQGGDLVEEYDLSQVPAAFYDGKRCELSIDEDSGKVIVECGKAEPETKQEPEAEDSSA